MKKKHILIVDDNEEITRSLGKYLTGSGYKVSIADDGAKGLNKYLKEKPDLVFLDIVMPGEDGIGALKDIKEVDEKAVVILMSGLKNEDIIRNCLKMGADDYITKPISLKTIKTIVSKYLK